MSEKIKKMLKHLTMEEKHEALRILGEDFLIIQAYPRETLENFIKLNSRSEFHKVVWMWQKEGAFDLIDEVFGYWINNYVFDEKNRLTRKE